MHVLIVGGGVAGLTCGRLLAQAGHAVTVFEASDRVGGRVRSDYADGYTFDRGFQVLFDSYPAARRLLDFEALDLRCFDPGAIICKDGHRCVLTDPLRERNPLAMLQATINPIVPPLDKLRTLKLAVDARMRHSDDMPDGVSASTAAYLVQYGFSQQAIDAFYRPFFGGIFLDRSLETSNRNFRFYFEMLSTGCACVPARGMQQISDQLAAPLHEQGRIRLQTRVQALLTDAEHVVGVRLDDDSEHTADAVVLATPAPEAGRLSGLNMPGGAHQTVNLYFGGPQPLYRGRKLVLNAAPDAFVNNAQMITNIAPDYAPAGQHLLSAVIIGNPAHLTDEELFTRAKEDLQLMFVGDRRAQSALESYQPLRLYRIAYAQFLQPPGRHAHLPHNQSKRPGLYFAAEFTEASSIHSAMISGEKCAAILSGRT
ncbi:MAG: FAD-dependent oxidoreductase [Chloroflexaceae bacterium]|nr:FAD-dependent oxidoreductase [Chloroflexaceae bacterium]NJO07385.1 FAD-dependent oxidoreductase [Chloroflexaceae bacterium]